jgi:hypothetical protein
VTAVTVPGARPGRDRTRLSQFATRILRIEIRRSAFVWSIPLLAVLFVVDPLRTASGYPALWTLRASVVLNRFWVDCVPFATGFSAWAGSREGRRNVSDLLGTTVRPGWTRQLCSLAGTLAWVLLAFLTGVAVLYLSTALVVTWGGPPIWPVAVGATSLTAACAFAFTLAALFPGRFTAPIVTVGIIVFAFAVFTKAVSEGGTSVFALSPDSLVPGNDTGVFYPVAPDVSIVQVIFYAGAILGAAGLLGLSPRTGGVGWRGALNASGTGGARLRVIATAVFAAGVALAVAGFSLAATAKASSVTGGVEVPALHDPASDKPIQYTPVCAEASGGFQVCVHPAFRGYLSQAVNSFGPVIGELSGLPGVPVRAAEVAGQALPSIVLQVGGNGVVTDVASARATHRHARVAAGPVYEFTMGNAITSVPDAARFRDGFQQDIVHAVIVGRIGQITASGAYLPNAGTLAQQAVVDGLLKAVRSQPYPACNPFAQHCTGQPQVVAAAARFAALPAATRHAWLVANLAALKAGRITLAQIP